MAAVAGVRVTTTRAACRVQTFCMALTPDAIPHLSPPLTAPDPAADAAIAEGLAALESYKKKDPAKGSVTPSVRESSRN